MSEAVLVALIFSLCPGGTKEQRLTCHEQYVNCAITDDGILSREDFETKCLTDKKSTGRK